MEDNRPFEIETVEPPARPLPKPNPVTRAAHRREVLRQVTLPLILFVLGFIALVVWFVLAKVGTVAAWSQIATIFLVLPAMMLSLLLLVVLAGLVYVIAQALHFLPPYARLTQDAIERVNQQVKAGADVSAKPIIQIRSYIAMLDALFGRIDQT